jgi:hypothetical protein
MQGSRIVGIMTALAAFSAAPAQAQVFWLPPNFSGPPLNGYEQGIGVPLPGATPAEQKAAIVWNVRSALNVAALQCGFDPTLRAVPNYNAILNDHSVELASAFRTLDAYFKRTSRTKQAAQKALDTYGTKTYSGFSTVRAQFGFCTAAARVGRIALFTPKGRFVTMAEEHLRALRNSLQAQGEQQFRFPPPPPRLARIPNLDDRCWKKNRYDTRCGLL